VIDVIIPAYNNSETIDETIESIVRQSIFKDIKVIVVDDASQDNTLEKLSDWSRGFTNITVERNAKNLGVMGNYRRLVSIARQKYIAPLEGDDIWNSNTRLEKLVEYLERTSRPACFNGFLIVDRLTGEAPPNNLMWPPRYRRVSAFDMLDGNPPSSFSNCIYRREVLTSVLEEINGAAGYDWLVNTVIAARHDGLDFYPEVLSSYRVHPTGAWSSLAADKKNAMIVATLKSIQTLLPPRYTSTVDKKLRSLDVTAAQ
jgi:glycosyltransferase involved in cell wall biosynthesis